MFTNDCAFHISNKDLTKLLETLQNECGIALKWFENNDMIVNPGKFLSIFISSKKNLSCKPILKINDVFLFFFSVLFFLEQKKYSC